MKIKSTELEAFEAMLDADAGQNRGTSELPSDNSSPLELNESEWQWIDAVYLAKRVKKKHGDPSRLIALLAKERVPPRVMRFVRGLLEMSLGGKPSERIKLPTRKATAYHFAEKAVRELEAQRWSKSAAIEKVAPNWGLTPKALAESISGRPGYSRKLRA